MGGGKGTAFVDVVCSEDRMVETSNGAPINSWVRSSEVREEGVN